jgi:hypothetical protein
MKWNIYNVGPHNLVEGATYKLTYGFPDESYTVTALYRGFAQDVHIFWLDGLSYKGFDLYEHQILSAEEISESTETTIETVETVTPSEPTISYGTCINDNGDLEIYIMHDDEETLSPIVSTIPSVDNVGHMFSQSVTFSYESDVLEFLSNFPNSIVAYSITDEHHITIHYN